MVVLQDRMFGGLLFNTAGMHFEIMSTLEKIEDGFVEKFLAREGESVEEAKVRLVKEQEEN